MSEEKTTCCGGPAPKESDACCVKDAEAKAAGETGCACTDDQPAATASCCG